MAEKACKTVRLLGFLIQNGVSKSNMQDVMRRGKSIGKALNNAVARHHEALTCRSRDPHMSFVSPLDYQFSCSGSPPRPSYVGRRRLSLAATHGGRHSPAHKVVRMCRGGESDALVGHYCPVRRRVKIAAGSPSASSMLGDPGEEKEFRVDEAAEEFIERFHRELRLQKWLDHYC